MAKDSDIPGAEQVERSRMSAAELSWALRSVNRAASQLEHALAAKVGLRALDFEAMGHIMDLEGTQLGPAELGHRLGISTGSATELADRLEAAGHIARARDATDRRRVNLVPQASAVGRILGELAPLFTALDSLALEFSPEEQAAISRYLRAAADELQTHSATLTSSSSDE
ncbi:MULTISPECIES: MarR family transcriptional regulator [Cryobacterium]|uniref:MarR family transcriptional regulator n=1 Tax=Cryobacterium zongtaii TaxID=1259217 RepID=A0A2S3ZGE1_9MICO|nr:MULTISPECIES: MarR family transcriptional regulator [Cryobacterium]POH65975.1 MarR family transcriptional regulator [Cryobacterium zongtaii]